METEQDGGVKEKRGVSKSKSKSKQMRSTYIREDADEIVDLVDLKSISNVLSECKMFYSLSLKTELTKLFILSSASGSAAAKPIQAKSQPQIANGGFKTADDGRLIISDKAFRGKGKNVDDIADGTESDDSTGDSGHDIGGGGSKPKRGMEDDSSDEEELRKIPSAKRNRKATDSVSMRSGKTATTMRKGIHRSLGGTADDAMSVKSVPRGSNKAAGGEYSSKKAKGDMKLRGKLDPYAYIPLTRNTLNKR